MAELGNDLYTGRRSVDFVGRARTWYAVSAVLILIAVLALGVRGLNFGLEFTGGSEFRVATSSAPADYEDVATDAVREVAGSGSSARVSTIGGDTVRVQTEELGVAETREVSDELATAFDVGEGQVSSNLIGPSWGQSVSEQALRALVVFIAFTAVLMALYFRTWKMAAAAMVALVHDMIITVGVFVLSGFEVSPATMIGFLTVLGYSLYDTVVVFDKVRENATEAFTYKRSTYAEAANRAVNQTLVRSINTTVIALLPILAVLVIGFARLGPGTLLDLSLVLFVGLVAGAFSSIFIATPLLVQLRRKDDDVQQLTQDVAELKEKDAKAAARGSGRRRSAAGGRGASRAGSSDRASATSTGTSGGGGAATATAERDPRRRTGRDTGRDATRDTQVSGSSSADQRDAEDGDARDDVAEDAPQTVTGRTVHRYAQSSGPRNQPKKQPKAKRGRRS
ncbi:protein translocase subunit SecF [Janibacter alkaliphilus]|nr:protein translocase subunit SecF [Janibacter alkaliphilus]